MSEQITVFQVFDRIDLLVAQAKKVPLTGKIMVDQSELTNLLRQAQAAISPDVALARQVLIERDGIIANARAIEEDGKRKADQTINEAAMNAEEIVNRANYTAQQTVEEANSQANATVTDANARAADAVRLANDQATQTVAQAQQQASDILAEANERARQLIEENEITARAREQAEQLMDTTQRECAAFREKMNNALSDALGRAENGISEQLEALKKLKESIG